MNTLINVKFLGVLILPAFVIGICMLYKGSVAQEKVSAFGKYEGYSEAIYDGGRRTSDYLPLSYLLIDQAHHSYTSKDM